MEDSTNLDEKISVWNKLINRDIDYTLISEKWKRGFSFLKPLMLEYPNIEDLAIPNWRLLPIIGKSPDGDFWRRLSCSIFNVNMRLRPEQQIDYLEERDYFHDLFGHTPILFDDYYSNYMRALGIFGQFMEDSDEARRALSNIYWFTSEFGLVMEDNKTVAYGAGIISSTAELKYALSPKSKKILMDTPFCPIHETLEWIAKRESYITDGFQDEYYVLNDWSDLDLIVTWLWHKYGRLL